MKIEKKYYLGMIFVALVMIYFTLPVLAGKFEIGEKEGPRLYPVELHKTLYDWGWGRSHETEGLPASEIKDRPWFYFF